MKLIRAAAVRDARGIQARPGGVLVQAGRVVEAGALQDLSARHVARAEMIDRPEHLILPLLVNAHAHLDLTTIGPQPYQGDFLTWLKQLIAIRPTAPAAVGTAVEQGLRLSREAGVGWLGDVAGSVAAITARQQAGPGLRLPGASYLECFGHGDGSGGSGGASGGSGGGERVEQMLGGLSFETPVPHRKRGVVLGISPHAPYSAGLALYESATRLSQEKIYRLTTHLAESEAELEFVRDATGPFVDMLRELGKWDDAIQPTGMHPIEWLRDELKRGRWLLAHCNYVDDEHIDILRRTGTSVAYCPVASDYFGHRGHRYRDMLDAGVNVCLGTDSILCQPAASGEQAMSILAQMRHLYRRDATDPALLLRMATINGLIAMDFRGRGVTLGQDTPAAFCAVRIDPDLATDPLTQAMENDAPAELLAEV